MEDNSKVEVGDLLVLEEAYGVYQVVDVFDSGRTASATRIKAGHLYFYESHLDMFNPTDLKGSIKGFRYHIPQNDARYHLIMAGALWN